MTGDFGLRPAPPRWALEGGLPSPEEDETFTAYATRIGLDPERLLAELTPRTAPLANVRMDSALGRIMPEAWEEAVDREVKKHIPSERRKQLELIAANLFGDRFRGR